MIMLAPTDSGVARRADPPYTLAASTAAAYITLDPSRMTEVVVTARLTVSRWACMTAAESAPCAPAGTADADTAGIAIVAASPMATIIAPPVAISCRTTIGRLFRRGGTACLPRCEAMKSESKSERVMKT